MDFLQSQPEAKKAKRPRKKQREVSLADKAEALHLLERGLKQHEVADRYGGTQNTVSGWKANKDKIFEAAALSKPNRARIRADPYEEINKLVLGYLSAIVNATDGRPRVTSWLLIQRKAVKIAKELASDPTLAEPDRQRYLNFKASNRWLHRLFNDNSVVRRCLKGLIEG